VTFWIDYGTLWGAIRDNAIMEFDNDVDVGVWLKDVPKISQMKKDFKREGYDLRINKNHLNYVIHKISTGEHLGCILFREKQGDYAVRIHFKPYLKFMRLCNLGSGGFIVRGFWNFILKHELYEDLEVSSKMDDLGVLSTIDFYGEEFPTPEFPIRYLDWMYPYRDWRVKSDKPLHGAEIGRRRERLKEVIKNERGTNLENKVKSI
jgi:hypothetical protein